MRVCVRIACKLAPIKYTDTHPIANCAMGALERFSWIKKRVSSKMPTGTHKQNAQWKFFSRHMFHASGNQT